MYCISTLYSAIQILSLSLSEPVSLIQTTSICILWTLSIEDGSRGCEPQFVPNQIKLINIGYDINMSDMPQRSTKSFTHRVARTSSQVAISSDLVYMADGRKIEETYGQIFASLQRPYYPSNLGANEFFGSSLKRLG